MKQVNPVSEEEIIIAIRNGDDQVLKKLYRQHYQLIAKMVINNGGSLQEAKDIYQESVIIFYEKLQEETFVLSCQIGTFIYSVSRKLWLKQLKLKSRFTGDFDETAEYVELNWNETLDKEEQYQSMHTALEGMGEPCKSILMDFYMNSASMEDITEKFGYTNTDNAKTQKYKCLKRLKKIFFSHYQND